MTTYPFIGMWRPPVVDVVETKDDGRSYFYSDAYGAKFDPRFNDPNPVGDGFPWSPTDPRGGCVFDHRVVPIGTHQCMGPGMPPGDPIPDQDDRGDNSDVGDDGGDGGGDGGGD